MEIGQRIEKFLEAKDDGNMSELGRYCGVTPQAVQQWIAGGTTPRGKRLRKIADFFGISESELVYGDLYQTIEKIKGDPPRHAPVVDASATLPNLDETAASIDRRRGAPGRRADDYDLITPTPDGGVVILELKGTGGSMGDGLLLRDQPGEIQGWRVSTEWINKNVKTHTGTSNLRIVTGFGDSMRPLYNPGDPLLVDAGVRAVEFDSIYFFRIADEGFIKRLQRVPGQGLLAISENKSYRDWVITPDMDFEVFARVIKVWCGSEF